MVDFGLNNGVITSYHSCHIYHIYLCPTLLEIAVAFLSYPNNSYKTKKNFTGSYTEVNSYCSKLLHDEIRKYMSINREKGIILLLLVF